MFGDRAARQQRRDERRARRERAAAERATQREALRAHREKYPVEKQLNQAATMRLWPSATMGTTGYGPVKGASAELFNADAHKSWTATRLIAGAATLGSSAALTGRKNKGAAAITITFADGTVRTFKVVPEALQQAHTYVTAWNSYAEQLDQE